MVFIQLSTVELRFAMVNELQRTTTNTSQ